MRFRDEDDTYERRCVIFSQGHRGLVHNLRTELGYCIPLSLYERKLVLKRRNLSEEDRANMQNVPVHPVLELSKYLPLVDHVVSMHGAQRATEVTTMQQ